MRTSRSLTGDSWSWSNRISSGITQVSILVFFFQAYLHILRVLRGVHRVAGYLSNLLLLLLVLIYFEMLIIFLLLQIRQNSSAISGLHVATVIKRSLLEVILGSTVFLIRHKGTLLAFVILKTHIHFCVGKQISYNNFELFKF